MRLERVSRKLSGSDDALPRLSQSATLKGEPTPFAVANCRTCGLQYVNPPPLPTDNAHFYPWEFVPYRFVLAARVATSREKSVVGEIA